MEYITEILQLDSQMPFAVFHGNGFSEQDVQDDKAYMHRHHSLEINFCLWGEGKYIIGEKEYEIHPYDMFIINDLEYHQAIDTSGKLQLLVVVFDADLVLSGGEDYALIRAFYERKTRFAHRISADIALIDEILPIAAEIDKEWQQKKIGYRMVLKALLIQLLAMIYRGFERAEGYAEAVRHFQSAYARLAPAIALIEDQFAENLPLERLAGTVHMNRNYFSTLFSQLMGCTVSDYILRRRLRHAMQLLMSTDDSIISIAMDSGFRSVSYFDRVFRKQFGVSPGKYRETVRDAGK